jgi:ribose transport system ATP-binding protein
MLEMKGINKSFPGVQALDDVNFAVRRGEVHALVGGNGAGKSTLMKILAGAIEPDRGQITVRGETVGITNPETARKLGIAIIYQELNLVPTLNAVENVFLGCEIRKKGGLLDITAMTKATQELFKRLELDVSLKVPVGSLSVAQQQMIEIAKALHLNAEILVMDEPTAALTDHDINTLFDIVLRLKEKGVTIIYISHRLEEIYRICDRVTVMRDGKIIGTRDTDKLSQQELIRMMINRNLTQVFPESSRTIGKEVLRVENLTRKGVLNNINLTVCAGEVVGIAGLVGSGRTELVRAIYGADPVDSGAVYINGEKVSIKSPHCAVRCGVGFVPEDRKEQGVILRMAVKDNMTLACLPMIARSGVLSDQRERRQAQQLAEKLKVKTSGLSQLVGNLSGGNQQKVALAKWLATNAGLLIFDEPTRGIDVGAKTEIYSFLRELAREGLAVIMVSSDLLEILGLSDRIYVMYNGTIAGEVPGEGACQEKVMSLAMGAGA